LNSQQTNNKKSTAKFEKIKDIAAGSNHCLAFDIASQVYSWGNGQGGRLGHGDETGQNMPKLIEAFKDMRILMIECGETSSAALSGKNEIYMWGSGNYGRLGNGSTADVLLPTKVEDLSDQKVDDISIGSTHAMCILRNGKGKVWGQGKHGKLGLEGIADRNFSLPKDLVLLEKERLFQVAAGPFHSMALTEEGDLFTWGNAKDGKLGYESMLANVILPTKIKDISF